MGEHSVREAEIDDWLRQEVLVDLYRVVKQALRAGVPSYSIKEIEELYGFVRTAEVTGGDESVVLFEKWLESGDDALLEGIRAYNEEDCRSTVALHEWLLALRPRDCRGARRTSARCRGGGGAGRGAGGAARGAARGAEEEGARAGSSRTSSTTTAARRSRSGGSGSTTSGSTRTS